ncbi:MAG TPA: CPBP family intramembrane glutamic endopeptidase [Terriglobia bacterium]|nr:CPBP family intramembrane glutamic endopeptidase [Terriglobia bacterium]
MDIQPIEKPAIPGFSTWHIVVAMVTGVVYLLMFILGGEFRTFALTGLFAIPFMLLAVLTYSAELKSGVWKGFAMVYWVFLAVATAFVAMLFTIAAIALPAIGPVTELDPATMQTASDRFPTLEHSIRIVAAIGALFISGVISLVCFLPAIRRKASTVIHTHAESFVHATALATAVAITLMCFIPLVAVGGPPLLPMLQVNGGMALPPADEQLRSTLYTLIWGMPAAFLAVGYPLKRTLREARLRLGLDRPSVRQLVFAVVMTGALLLAMPLFGVGIEFLWKTLGWPLTDQEAIKLLFGFTAGPVAAFIASVVAGLGEELVFRGVLQPRLGIFLPALMFTSVHAFQYNFDALIQVLVLGLIFGVVRKRSNTTTAAIIHFGYDFVLLLTTI